MKTTKYNNKRATYQGESFDSQAELKRYQDLQRLQKAGLISGLTRQTSFVLAPKVVINGTAKRSLTYRADFQYLDQAGKVIVEDKKGALTDVYKIKRHLMKSVHNIDILET